jgi:hypothetical protein
VSGIQGLSLFSQISLYVLLALMGLFALLIGAWQVMVLQGKAMKNPDGSLDDWHQQKVFYGMALADVFLACPATITGVILVFITPRWGYYLLSLVSFWFVWANFMTTANSLRFEKPRITLLWFVTFPLGSLVGLTTIIWILVHFDKIFFT